MRVVFFGTPAFARDVLKTLIEASFDIVAVVTKPEQLQGRNRKMEASEVQEFAIKAHIPVYQPEKCKDTAFLSTLAAYNADIFVVVAYGEIVPQELLDIPRFGCINLHASLLPRYRGAAPIHYALLHGDEETGVSIIQMTRKMDAGDILGKVIVAIDKNMEFEALEKELCSKGAQCLIKVLQEIQAGTPHREVQNPDEVTFAHKITVDMAAIDWKKSYRDIHNQVRAFSKKPGAFCFMKIRENVLRVKIRETTFSTEQGSPGTVQYPTKKRLVICCGDGALEIVRVQLPGKPVVDAAQFLQGYYGNIHIVEAP